jgi:two-component system sensor histidine kinase AlgZ
MKPAAPPPKPATAVVAGSPADAEAEEGFGATVSRPASLWPESTRPLDLPAAGESRSGAASTSFNTTRFDPLAEENSRLALQTAAAFDVCHPALALRAVLLVQAALAIVALAGAHSLAHWLQRQGVLAFGGVAATLVWLVVVCALRTRLRRVSARRRSAAVLMLGAAAALLAWVPLAWAGLTGGGGLQLAGVALAGTACAALLWAWLDLRSRIWHPANAAARLAELQSRIRPHFLFNALNTALALVRVDASRAEAVLEDLAELFRVALADTGASVSLEEEIELARRYLAIEQVRFGPRLRLAWDIDPRVLAARVPPLVLQPLVENAVRHGIEPAARPGQVRISALLQRGQVVVQVSNSVGDEPGQPGHGMALHNVRERLRLLHDVAAECDVWREGAEFHARLLLPAP